LRQHLWPIIAQLNTIINDKTDGLDPLTDEEVVALNLLSEAKLLLILARKKLDEADAKKQSSA
jgi:hypothetical protein